MLQLVHCKATQAPCYPRSKLSCLQNQVATLHLKLLRQNNTHTSTIYSYSSYFYVQRSQSMAVNHIETANVLLPGEVKNRQKSGDGWRSSNKVRLSSCASYDLYSTPYLIKQASLFHGTGSRVPRECVAVLFVLSLVPRAFPLSKGKALGPRQIALTKNEACTTYFSSSSKFSR